MLLLTGNLQVAKKNFWNQRKVNPVYFILTGGKNAANPISEENSTSSMLCKLQVSAHNKHCKNTIYEEKR